MDEMGMLMLFAGVQKDDPTKRGLIMNRRDFVIGTLAITAMPANVFSMSETLIVHRTETCGCCGEWVKRMISGGVRATVEFANNEVLKSINHN